MAGLVPSPVSVELSDIDRLTYGIGRITNGETITIPSNRQVITGPIELESGSIEFNEGSELHFIQ